MKAAIIASGFIAWGIVGKIERGGDLRLALWLIPLLAVMFIAILYLERKEEE